MGDIVLCIPHLRSIIKAHPDDRVVLLTAPEYAGLAATIPGLEVVSFRRKGFIEMWRVLGWLLGQRFDVVYDLQGSLRSRVMTLVTRANKRVGDIPGIAYTYTPPAGDKKQHAFQRLNDVLVAGGVEAAPLGSQMTARADDQARVDTWLGKQDLNDKRLVPMHAGSSARWLSKRWDEVKFAELAQVLEKQGFTVLWIGGDDERELNGRLAAGSGIDVTGAFTFPELLALGCRSAFAVTNDSSPMHILAAAGLPVYAFFGPTDWRQSHAPGQEDRVLTNPVECSPCYLKQCPAERGHACMQQIAPDAVLKRIEADGLL